MRASASLLAALVLLLVLLAPGASAHSIRDLPKKYRHSPYTLMSLSVGYPNDGWQLRAKKLRRTRYLRIKPSSKDNCYGHPALVLMLHRSAKELYRAGHGSVMVVGDLSSKTGGRLYGHHSHQSGRDADVAFYMKDKDGKAYIPDHFVKFGADGKATDGSGLEFDDWRNWLLVQSWVRDKRAGLNYIFVADWLKHRLVKFAEGHKEFKKYVPDALKVMHQPEDAEPHDDHFHVRISCPRHEDEICHEQSR